MVVCAVKLCTNYMAKYIKPPKGISFHRFPSDPYQKQLWLSALRISPDWSPGNCRVCSVHFENADFVVTDTGRRILIKNAVPSKNLYRKKRSYVVKTRVARKITSTKPASADTEHVLACRLCLVTDVRLYNIHDSQMTDALRQVTGCVVTPADGLPQHLCSTCWALLRKSSEFRSRCDNAQDVLQELRSKETLTTDLIRTVDRNQHNLVTPLTVVSNVNYYNINPDENNDILNDNQDEISDEEMKYRPDIIHDNQDKMSDEETKYNDDIFNDNEDEISDEDTEYNHDIFNDNREEISEEEKEYNHDIFNDNKDEISDEETEYNHDIFNDNQDKISDEETEYNHDIFNDNQDEISDQEIKYHHDISNDKQDEISDKEATCEIKNIKSEFEENRPSEETFTILEIMPEEIKTEKVKKLERIDNRMKDEEKKEDIRNFKARKTNEDYLSFAKQFNVDVKVLSLAEQIKEVQARRETDNYKNSKYKCERCFKGFSRENTFKNHMAKHDPALGNYVCEPCGFRFPKRYKMLNHLRHHNMHFVCKMCAHISKAPSKAKDHFNWHNGAKYPCQLCDMSFNRRSSQFNHMRSRHGSVSCDLCQEIFSGERGLRSHINKTHRQVVKYRCASCGVQFLNEDSLSRHLETSPEGICQPGTRACAHCGSNFNTEDELIEHSRVNHWKEIRCEKCNAVFENEKLYKMHAVTHKELRVRRPHSEPKPRPQQRARRRAARAQASVMCEMCGLSMQSPTALRYHQRVHTGEKPHQCPHCPKKFRMQSSLQFHLNTHTGARPFKCPHCPKAFKSSMQIYRHQLVHTKVRRFRCDLCDKTFLTSSCVKVHIKTVHMKIPLPPRVRKRKSAVKVDTSD